MPPPTTPSPPPTAAGPHYLPYMRTLTQGLRQRCGVAEGDHLVVACSGGADSVALLRGLDLLRHRRKWRLGLTVVHVHHHLREPEAADGDAAFVRSLAERLDLPFVRQDITPGAMRGNVEANARELRYAALARIARARRADFVATGHHADDQLETLLMAMLRGTTAAGMRGIAWTRLLLPEVHLIRPMLGATRDQAFALLSQMDQRWREDATNQDRSRTRARLRHEVLPVLRELRPDVALKALQLSDHLRELTPGRSESRMPPACLSEPRPDAAT